MPQDYWTDIRNEMYRIQQEHALTDVELMIHFEPIMAEAMDRLYVNGLYEAMPQEELDAHLSEAP